jgi:fatty acid desaturase
MSPREEMADRLPQWLQPFLTWLTGIPAPVETYRRRSPISHFIEAVSLTVTGVLGTVVLVEAGGSWLWLVPVAMAGTVAGLGLLHIMIFHHCAHGTVFNEKKTNYRVGWWLSAIFLFKHFEIFRRDHLSHHNVDHLLTEEDDEFGAFIFDQCRLEAGMPIEMLRRRVAFALISPVFHLRFLGARAKAAMASHDWRHNLASSAIWGAIVIAGIASGHAATVLLAWVAPITVLHQIVTSLRVLREHRFPDADTFLQRDSRFVSEATTGVFLGRYPPSKPARSLAGLLAWTAWWADALFVQVPLRFLVNIGDVPCHDWHHRFPKSREWANYQYARESDRQQAQSSRRGEYSDIWGLFHAIDLNLQSLANMRTRPMRRDRGEPG